MSNRKSCSNESLVLEGEGDQADVFSTASRREDLEYTECSIVTPSRWWDRLPLVGILLTSYSKKFVFSLGGFYLLNKGVASTLVFYSQQPMFMNRMGTTSMRYQRLSSLGTMGFSLKAIVATLADTFPLFGYTKRWYMLGSCILGAALSLVFAALPSKPSSDITAGVCIFLINFSIANIDVLSQGFYSRLIRQAPATGPSMVSWVWWCIYCGYVIGSVISGPITDKDLPQVPIYIAAGFQLSCCVFFALNWYGEKKNKIDRKIDLNFVGDEDSQSQTRSIGATEKEREGATGEENDALADLTAMNSDPTMDAPTERVPQTPTGGADAEPEIITCLCGALEFNKDLVKKNWRVIIYCFSLSACVITLAVVTMLASKWGLLYTCIVTAVVCCGAAFWALPLTIAKAVVFIYIHKALYLSLPGALNNFYLATPDCLADGPHFNYTFYYTVTRIITSAAGMLGAFLFTYCFSKSSFRLSFIVVILLEVVASLFDLIMVKRWNIDIGIPDHAMYLFGDAIVYEVVDALSSMPLQMLMSRLCPRGSESMLFALLAGVANMGGSMAYSIGSLLMELVWPVGKCEFSNVPYLVIVGHLAFPLAAIPLVFLLLPNTNINDNVSTKANTEVSRLIARLQRKQRPADSQMKPNDAVEGSVEELDENLHKGRPAA